MQTRDRIDAVVRTLRERDDLLRTLAEFITGEALISEETSDVAEAVCVAAFGERVECEVCGSPYFNGFPCWGCE